MGRKTWNSLPVKPLPNRGNYIISSAQPLIMDKNTIRFQMEDALNYLNYTLDDVFIIGGGLSKAGDLLCDTTEKHYRELVLFMSKETDIKMAILGNDAGIYGAARMAI